MNRIGKLNLVLVFTIVLLILVNCYTFYKMGQIISRQANALEKIIPSSLAQSGYKPSFKIDWNLISLKGVQKIWDKRFYHASFVFNDRIWVMGGNGDKRLYSDIWNSKDGITWELVNKVAPWSERSIGNSVTIFKNRIFLIGGYVESEKYKSDIWSSSDGISWDRVVEHAPFGNRYLSNVVTFKNEIFLVGGSDELGYKDDIWSSPDGVNWEKVSVAPWRARYGSTLVEFKEELYFIGGGASNEKFSDVWKSADGKKWELVIKEAPFGPKIYHSSFVYNNELYLLAGFNSNFWGNDVWKSTDGKTWEIAKNSPWKARDGQSAINFNNKIFLMGGYAPGGNTHISCAYDETDNSGWPKGQWISNEIWIGSP